MNKRFFLLLISSAFLTILIFLGAGISLAQYSCQQGCRCFSWDSGCGSGYEPCDLCIWGIADRGVWCCLIPTPSVDIRANGIADSITIPPDTSADLTWGASNVNSCTASGAWSGSKPLWGSESTGVLSSTQTYTLTCTGSIGSASDSVTVNVQGAAGGLNGGTFGFDNPLNTSEFAVIVDRLIDLIFKIAVVVAPLMIGIGAFLFATAGGKAEQINNAKKIIIWTLIGFVIVLLARGIIEIVRNLFGI